MASGWSLDEVEIVVADYFAMLHTELRATPYSKAEHNRRLQRRIHRSKGSIEFKHQNITAILCNLGQPSIAGYKPRQNYQALLEQGVRQWLDGYPSFFDELVDGPVLSPKAKQGVPAGIPTSRLIEEPPQWLTSSAITTPDVARGSQRRTLPSATQRIGAWDALAKNGSWSSNGVACMTTSNVQTLQDEYDGPLMSSAMARGSTSSRSTATPRHV